MSRNDQPTRIDGRGEFGPLSACGALLDLPGKGPPSEAYNLRGALPARATGAVAPLKIQLVVQEPACDRELDSDRIAIALKGRRLDYFANVRWTDRAPAMVQGLIVAAIERTGRLPAVARPGAFLAEIALTGDLMRFDAQGPANPGIAIALRLRLTTQPSGRMVATNLFEREVAAASPSVEDTIAAFEAGLRPMLIQIADWVIGELARLTP